MEDETGKGMTAEQIEQLINLSNDSTALREKLTTWISEAFQANPEQFDDTSSALRKFVDTMMNSKGGKLLAASTRIFDALPGIVTSGMNLANRYKDIGAAKEMIKKAEEAEAKLKKPAFTKPTADTTAVDRAIEGAEQDASVAGGGAVRSLRDQIRENYRTDIESAKNVSTGQASNVQAQAQVAQVRRNRQLRDIPLIEQRLRSDALARKDKLIGTRAGIQTANDRIRAASDPLRESRYQSERARIDELGATGRESLRNSRYNLAGEYNNVIGNVGKVVNAGLQTFGDFTPQNQGPQTLPGNEGPPVMGGPTAPLPSPYGNQGAELPAGALPAPTNYIQPSDPNQFYSPNSFGQYEWMQTPDYGQGPEAAGQQYQGLFNRNPYLGGSFNTQTWGR
jgi:hypothetical protein